MIVPWQEIERRGRDGIESVLGVVLLGGWMKLFSFLLMVVHESMFCFDSIVLRTFLLL